ncbi:NUAK SNF1-like kinase 1 [Phytophthora boehmeriae]|uniref:NUAK SNF1-like kinase 1 n=1 Tax=Phytophthora boehmeriae TaxID=109152 RepID=A0A8T1WQF5_9STRA|nr:NUAK SNF1-like kinase 1 [Phytophthora boehmeriae]
MEEDPLAALEAEYAAVVAQSRPLSEPLGDAESAGSDSEGEEGAAVGGFESYALLPSSPCHSDEETPGFNEEEATEPPESENKSLETSTPPVDAKSEPPMEEDKRRVIMQSMQNVTLQPPPWAKAANLTDDKLVAMVQQQLQHGTKPTGESSK